jgi:hypothetical protein
MIRDIIAFFVHCAVISGSLYLWQHSSSAVLADAGVAINREDPSDSPSTDDEGLEEEQSLPNASKSSPPSVPSSIEVTAPNYDSAGAVPPLPPLDLSLPWAPLTGAHLDMYVALQGAAERRRENFPTTNLGRAWKFVEALQGLVRDFNRTYWRNSAAVAAPVVGNLKAGPNYLAMLRRFYRQNDPPKLAAASEILEEYKVRETRTTLCRG